MSTVITATAKLDKASYRTGELITVTVPGADAVSTNDTVQKLSVSLTAEDGTVQAFTADVPVTVTKHLPVRITGVSLGVVLGKVAPDGLSATVTAT